MRLALLIIFLCFNFALAQELQDAVEVISLVENGTLLPVSDKLPANECQDGEKSDEEQDVILSEDDVEILFTLEINKMTGLKSNPVKTAIPHNQEGFETLFETMIQAKNKDEREATYRDICRNFSQEDAIAFAGYIGKKNGNVYDYDRATGGSKTTDLVTIDDYFEVHRNVEFGENPLGPRKVGVCGDSARMIADFLKHCGFSCDDIDISSYRTNNSGGHQMVNARGTNGEYYTANWSEATVESGTNPMAYTTPTPNNINGSAFVEVFDCNGRTKAKTTTPLGSLILMAHGDPYQINGGQDYAEIKAVIEGLYVDEIVLKKFEAQDFGSGQRLNGLVGQINHQFGGPETFLTFDTGTSILVGKATRDLSYDLLGEPGELSQNIFSPRAFGTLKAKALSKGDLVLSPFIEGDVTGVMMQNNTLLYGDENSEKNADIMGNVGTGIELTGQLYKNKVHFSGKTGLRGQVLRNVSQKGQMQTTEGDVLNRSMIVGVNQVYAQGSVMINSSNPSVFKVNYQNVYALRQSLLSAEASKQFKNTRVSGNYFVLKNPNQSSLHGLGLGLEQAVKISDRHSLDLGAGAQYLIIDGTKNRPMVNVSLIYKFNKRKKRK